MRCTGCFSFDTDVGEKTKAFGAAILFLVLAGLWGSRALTAARLLGLNGCAFGDEGNAAADAAASGCGAGCRMSGAAVAGGSAAGGGLTGATGADLGTGLLIGANTQASVLHFFAAATVAAAATIAKRIRTVLETIRSWKLLNQR